MGREPYTFENQDSVPQSLVQQIQTLLKSWDQNRSDFGYLKVFKPDGTLHVLSEPSVGHEAIRELHDSMVNAEIGPVVKIQHHCEQIYTLPNQDTTTTEVIFTGTLSNYLLGGQCITTDYATKVVFSKGQGDHGPPLIEHLRVFSDTTEVMTAIRAILKNRQAN